MKRTLRICIIFSFCTVMLLALSLSASAAYEPDGSTSVKYEFDATECNRTLIVNCVDEEGTLLKKVQLQTKRGEELLCLVNLYGYELIGFGSDQGLWETCKVSWSSVNYVEYSSIFIWYYFRTGLSKDVMTATATLRKSEAITVKTCHNLRSDAGIDYNSNWFRVQQTDQCVVSYKDPFTSSAKEFEGHYLMTGYSFQIQSKKYPYGSPPLICGEFYYTMIEEAYGITDITDWMTWEVVDKALKEEYKEYTTYSEEKDGTMGYCKNRVLQLDLYYQRCQYDIDFSANGGNGAPGTITQYYGYNITVPEDVPTRSGYLFLGWSTDENATSAEYAAGNTLPVTEAVTLYAVWEEDDYEFSISGLTISEKEIFPNTIITVSVRTDSWDDDEPYTDIPVELYYDGMLLATEWIDFDVYGVAYVTFRVDVGTVIGEHEIEVQINRVGIAREENQINNSVSTTVTVRNDAYAFGISPIENNAPYTEGITVITSYLISNDSDRMVLPDTGAVAEFTVYYFDENGEQAVIHTAAWNNLVIPIGESNLVYFKWTVPDDLAGTEVICTCTVNGDGALTENNRDNNTATLMTTIVDRISSQTPNSTFTPNAPSDYTPQRAPTESAGSASWTVWEYENGGFVLKKYGIRFADGTPHITPDSKCTSATHEGGVWTMRSGYGVMLNDIPYVTMLRGSEMPTADAYTDLQSVYARFPEYGYSTDAGEYSDLVFVNGEWRFAENEKALHYIPLWFSDGEYLVSLVLTEVWTPVGRMTAVRNSNVVVIDGSLYDDWYN